MSNGFGLAIESLVAILLLVTIAYCFLLNRRLKRLKADEHSLKATISELITATEIAERAIAGLKVTVRECNQGFGDSLRRAETLAAELNTQIAAGREVVDRVAQIALAARPMQANGLRTPEVHSTAAAAEAIAARARLRARGFAA